MSDAPIARMEDGVLVVRASALGNCVRALWAAATGYAKVDSPGWLNQMAQEGHLHEEDVRRRLMEDSGGTIVIRDPQATMRWEVVPGKAVVEGHVDGLIDTEPGPTVLEVKSMSDNVFKEFELNRFDSKPGYAWQVSAYMLGNGATEALYAYKNRNSGELQTFHIGTPPISEAQIRGKVAKVWSWIDRGVMPDCEENVNKFFCPFPYLHEEYGAEKVDLSGSDALDELAEEYMEVSDEIKALEVRKKELREGLVALVGGNARGQTDTHRINVSEKERAGLNKVLMEKEMGEEWMKKYKTKTKYNELRVTRR